MTAFSIDSQHREVVLRLNQSVIGCECKGFGDTCNVEFLKESLAVELDGVFGAEELLADFLSGEALGCQRKDLLLFRFERYRIAGMPAMVGKVIFLVAALAENAEIDVSWFFTG